MVKVFKQLIKYMGFAAIGLLFDYASLIILTEVFNLYYLIGICVGFMVGLAITFKLSDRFVFGKSKRSTRDTFILFGVIGLIGLLILNASVWVLTEKIELNYIVSKTIATIFVFLWNFFARKSLYHD